MGRGRGRVVNVYSGRGRGRSGGTAGTGLGRQAFHITANDNTPNSIKKWERPPIPNDPGEQQNVAPFSTKFEQAVDKIDPDNPNQSEYDRISNLVRVCHFNQTEFVMTLPPGDPEVDKIKKENIFPCFCSNFLWPGLKPVFPDSVSLLS